MMEPTDKADDVGLEPVVREQKKIRLAFLREDVNMDNPGPSSEQQGLFIYFK